MAQNKRAAVGEIRRALAAAGDRGAINTVFRAAMRGHGFSAYAAGFAPDSVSAAEPMPDRPMPFLLLDWPMPWLELYARQGFAGEDITLKEAAGTSEPFTWQEVQRKYPGASAHIFEAAKTFGWGDGFVIPVHDPAAADGERFGLVNLAAARLDDFDAHARTAVTAIALAAFGAARALDVAPRPQSRFLSEREAEALALVASGCGDEEVGRAMGVSRSTAHHHVESAKRKLSAVSRAQAVAIALSNNLLPRLS